MWGNTPGPPTPHCGSKGVTHLILPCVSTTCHAQSMARQPTTAEQPTTAGRRRSWAWKEAAGRPSPGQSKPRCRPTELFIVHRKGLPDGSRNALPHATPALPGQLAASPTTRIRPQHTQARGCARLKTGVRVLPSTANHDRHRSQLNLAVSTNTVRACGSLCSAQSEAASLQHATDRCLATYLDQNHALVTAMASAQPAGALLAISTNCLILQAVPED